MTHNYGKLPLLSFFFVHFEWFLAVLPI